MIFFEFVFILTISLFFLLVVKKYSAISIFHPVTMVGLWMIFFICGDAFYIRYSGYYGPSNFEQYPIHSLQVSYALLIWFIAFLLFILGVELSRLRGSRKNSALGFSRNTDHELNFIDDTPRRRVLGVVAAFSLLLAFYLIVMKIIAGGFTLAQAPHVRNFIFRESGFFLVLIQLFLIYLLVEVGSSVLMGEFSRKLIFFSTVAATAITLFFGMRSLLIYLYILPVLFFLDLTKYKLSIGRLVLFAIFGIFFIAILYRSLARDIYFSANEGLSAFEVFYQNLINFPQFLWGGFEISSLDGTIDIISLEHGLLLGESLFNGLVAFVPRFFWEGKPLGGGNTMYTDEFYPGFYSTMNAEYSLSGVGDLYWNFSVFGVVVFLIFGFVLGLVYFRTLRYVYNTNRLSLAALSMSLYAIILFRFFSFLRGDLFNFVSQLFTALIPVVLVYIILVVGFRRNV
ncbi:O-antigen polymerase [Marinobacterium sp. xm-d-564]|uniref:O-antigen polymerase n=1 Tax=Marinobacterium sp. xm-d-564 TaxID=2497742 RepID=UPI00156855E1|nr:O-antigen polymerase [Marinobacterium sp. xm-d-564]NRP59897.1 hypothetical protein [Marinobacterium sp. xm-d-564]